MSQGRETEFKYTLSEDSRNRLKKCLGTPSKTREFANLYFSLPEASDRRDWVLRLRVENQRRELTLKIGRKLTGGVFDSIEITDEVSSDEPGSWLGTEVMQVFHREIGHGVPVYQGRSKTLRQVFAAPITVGDIWELDSCCLPDGKSFAELEIEVEYRSEEELEECEGRLKGWLTEQGIVVSPSQRTKYARFLEALENEAESL